MIRHLRPIFQSYSRALLERPYATQMLTAGTLWATGDVLAQNLEGNPYDWQRTLRLAFFGFAFSGPLNCWWYRRLDKFTNHLAANKLKFLASKVFLDQCVFEPPHMASFFIATSLIEGHSFEWIKEKMKEEYISTYLMDCRLWPVVQALNFYFVPLHWQALVVHSVSIGWNAYLSMVRHREVPSEVVAAKTTKASKASLETPMFHTSLSATIHHSHPHSHICEEVVAEEELSCPE
mmetsp:Transcript_42581/g.107448  ORF Transcript_42581/g.107448 Transcript_42581/m.107448 type:complete len:235 (-) Transcript_42581:176-880(-)